MTKQFVICKNDSPIYSLPLGTKEESAEALLGQIKGEQGEESSNGVAIYWRLREVELLETHPKVLNIYSVCLKETTDSKTDETIEVLVTAHSSQQALELAIDEKGWLPNLVEVTRLALEEPEVFCYIKG